MVIDTSVLYAILTDEPEAPAFEAAIDADPVRLLSAGTLLEISVVVEARFGPQGIRELDLLLQRAQVEVISVIREHVELGRSAFRNFGKGCHPAGLNFGDCFSYALSRFSGEPLLFKGNDFIQTDVQTVAWQSPAE
jgi:ribonuclease VapC